MNTRVTQAWRAWSRGPSSDEITRRARVPGSAESGPFSASVSAGPCGFDAIDDFQIRPRSGFENIGADARSAIGATVVFNGRFSLGAMCGGGCRGLITDAVKYANTRRSPPARSWYRSDDESRRIAVRIKHAQYRRMLDT